jgi:hypothetical protein
VTSAQQIHFWLTGPRLNLFLALLRVALVALLLLRALRSLTELRQRIFPTSNVAAAAASLFFILAAFGVSNARAADFPSQDLLNDLQRRLLEPRECIPNCATIPRMRLEIAGPALVIRMEINALADTAIPLPGGARSFVPAKVALDGKPADALSGTAEGVLWLQVHPGIHQAVIEGPIPQTDTVDIHLTLKPYRAEANAPSWVISGIHDDGMVDDNISLTRQRAPGEKSVAVEPGQLPPFLRVERNIHLGLQWETDTSVSRLNATGAPVTIQVPLLPGESITTAGIHVEGDKATISLGPGVATVAWHSTIKPGPQLQLTAPAASSWTEFWRLDASPFWHVETSGIPVVHSVLSNGPIRDREWSPWPGETVSLAITRPEGVPGETFTIDSTSLDVRPGRRSMESMLTLELRSSRGGERTFMLPAGAILTSFAINGVTQPLRQDHRSVHVTLTPGTQSVELKWMQDRGIKTHLVAPEVRTGLQSVNASTTIEMPPDRWTLFAGGGLLGPAVLFWGLVAIYLLVSIALSRIGLAPLSAAQWFLLSLGMTQTPFWMAAVAAGWLLALGWRRRNSDSLGKFPFRALQVLLVLWTAAALAFIFISIQKGLLGLPEMQISGNESTSQLLRWFHDRSGATLPRPWVISVPIMLYRFAMLAWALWLARAMLSWLHWGWESFSTGSLWRSSAASPESEMTG